MSINISRRKFLKAAGAGLLLPAAGCASTTGPKAAFQPPPNVVNRTFGKTGLKVCWSRLRDRLRARDGRGLPCIGHGDSLLRYVTGCRRQRKDLFRHYKWPGSGARPVLHDIFLKI